jgi:hypothetical protein
MGASEAISMKPVTSVGLAHTPCDTINVAKAKAPIKVFLLKYFMGSPFFGGLMFHPSTVLIVPIHRGKF